MAYGAEIFNSSGVKVLELSNRVARFVQAGTVTLPASGSVAVTVPGAANNDSWSAFHTLEVGAGANVTYAKSTNTFTFYNSAAASYTLLYWIIRS
jgi:hypothetical protein